jgi:DNA repair protein RAD50
MSSLDSLSIRGIRSFSDEEAQIISFAKPLNIIVGANGCGKTTIIECLKYVTTGELPPGVGSGASFVHDPKLAGKSEVKGQIKLKFKNRIPQTMVCVRDMAVTSKAKLTFKAMDSVIMTYKYGADGTKEKISLSHRCTEMDKLMPELLGVAKPVLQHVVFCHQEDSNWPLSDGAALKKRFDDIFEATRYTKALADIKTLRKERALELKDLEHRQTEVACEVHRVHELRDSIDNNDTIIQTLAVEEAAVQEQIQACESAYTELASVLGRCKEKSKALEALRAQATAQEQSLRGCTAEMSKLKGVEREEAERMSRLAAAEAKRLFDTMESDNSSLAKKAGTLFHTITGQ